MTDIVTGVVTDEELAHLNDVHGRGGTESLLRWAVTTFSPRISVAVSFGVEDVVVIHLLAGLGLRPRLFFLDTGRIHPETYETSDRIRDRYGVTVQVFAPETAGLEALVTEHGFHHFYADRPSRQACCEVRKLEPLRRALAGDQAWITGLRQEQGVSRTGVRLVERDPLAPERLKINPLAFWTTAEIWDLVRREDVPFNPLHERGYASIGCVPCTRPVAPGEPLRAGRWWWEEEGSRECGLHGRRAAAEGRA